MSMTRQERDEWLDEMNAIVTFEENMRAARFNSDVEKMIKMAESEIKGGKKQ